VQVTAEGSDNAQCRVLNWGPVGPIVFATVLCFDQNSVPMDSRFRVLLRS
jgi:hypothetical protein